MCRTCLSAIVAPFRTDLFVYASVPASIGVGDVLGLNTLNQWFTPHLTGQMKTEATTAAVAGQTTPNTGLLSPKDIASIYDVPATNHGNGRSMAILGDSSSGLTK